MAGVGLEPDREQDERDLLMFELLDVHKWSAEKVGDQVGLTRNAVLGIKYRFRQSNHIEAVACTCRKPENKDGGLHPGWWR